MFVKTRPFIFIDFRSFLR